jgi:hypothetical protein
MLWETSIRRFEAGASFLVGAVLFAAEQAKISSEIVSHN